MSLYQYNTNIKTLTDQMTQIDWFSVGTHGNLIIDSLDKANYDQTKANIDISHGITQQVNLGKYTSFINAVPSLINALNGIDTSRSIAENNLYQVYKLLLQHKQYDLTQSETTQLLGIAVQCASIGGKAVYIARALSNLYQDTLIFFNDDECLTRTQNRSAQLDEFSIKIYPNPTSDFLTVKHSGHSLDQNYYVYDALGKIVVDGIIAKTEQEKTFDITTLRPGIYFLQIGEHEVQKIIKH